MKGIVVKSLRGCFSVDGADGKRYDCAPRGKMRGGGIFCGDNVEFNERELVVERVAERKNQFARPPMSNITRALIVTAVTPVPDMLLIDKMLVKCYARKIEPVLCMDKNDLPGAAEYFDKLKTEYAACCDKILSVSAKTGNGIPELCRALGGRNEIICVAGQSAMGKSSILNAVLPLLSLKTGGISEKSGRGRHTTRHTEMFSLPDGGYIADTAGFSLLSEQDIEAEQLKYYYPEFVPLQSKCKYYGCNHLTEPDCAVMAELSRSVSSGRYQRYKDFYAELNDYQKKKYR